MRRFISAPVVGVKSYANGNFLLGVHAPEIAETCRPGQFVMISQDSETSFPAPLLKRALAIYSQHWPGEDRGALTFIGKVVGDGTRLLSRLCKQDKVGLIGPLGNGFQVGPDESQVTIMVAGGTGIASFFMLASQLLSQGRRACLVYGGRSRDDLVGLDDFRDLGIATYVTTEDGTDGLQGLVTQGLERALSDHSTDSVSLLTCGPTGMMRAVSSIASERGVGCQISVENRMGCGFGVCLGCTVKTTDGYKLACTEGPVFDAAQFEWEPER